MLFDNVNTEIDTLYQQVFASGVEVRSVTICAANEQEGVTSLALRLAERSIMAGKSTLVVDLNLYHPSLELLLDDSQDRLEKTSNQTLLSGPGIVSSNNQEWVLTGVPAPLKRSAAMELKNPGVLEQCIARWKEEFDCIIFDTSPINRVNANNIPAVRVAESCDATIMVVLAAKTTNFMLTSALQKLNATKANLIGCVYNDYLNPSLKSELIREARRLPRCLNGLTKKLCAWLEHNRFLSIEV